MNIPEKCKDCIFFNIKDNNEYRCMLSHNLDLAAGCPNKKKNNEYS